MDKRMEYAANEKILVGKKTRQLLDVETGEVFEANQVIKRTYGEKQFWKMYLMDFLSVLGVFDSRQVDVFIYIAENTNASNNMFIGTYSKISKDVNVSSSTIAAIMKKLQAHNFIKKVQNGVWLVNPDIIMKGNEKKRELLLTYFNSEEPIEELTKPKIKNTECEVRPKKRTIKKKQTKPISIIEEKQHESAN